MDAATHLSGLVEPESGLSDRDREILEFERQWWKYAGAKETALIDRPEALEADPLLVRRLRRLRAARQRQRSARRLGFEV
jgi:hypothetical protein